jgi:hypothetical protein
MLLQLLGCHSFSGGQDALLLLAVPTRVCIGQLLPWHATCLANGVSDKTALAAVWVRVDGRQPELCLCWGARQQGHC